MNKMKYIKAAAVCQRFTFSHIGSNMNFGPDLYRGVKLNNFEFITSMHLSFIYTACTIPANTGGRWGTLWTGHQRITDIETIIYTF